MVQLDKPGESGEARDSRLAALLDCLPIGVGLFDATGRYVACSGALRRMYGLTVGALDPEQIARWQVFDADGHSLNPSQWPSQRALRGERNISGFVGTYTSEDGEQRDFRVTAMPCNRTGVEGVVLLQHLDNAMRARTSERDELEMSFVEVLFGTIEKGCNDPSDAGASSVYRMISRALDLPAGDEHELPSGLTKREAEVLKLVAWGYCNKEIGIELGISVKTVEFHRAAAMARLRLRRRVDIVRYALGRQWLHL